MTVHSPQLCRTCTEHLGLENQFHRALHNPRLNGTDAGDLAEVGCGRTVDRGRETCVIESIERLPAELEIHILLEHPVFRDPKVGSCDSWSREDVLA